MGYHLTQIYNGNLYVAGLQDVDMTDANEADDNVVLNYLGIWNGNVGVDGWTTINDSVTKDLEYTNGVKVVSPTEIYAYGSFSQIGTGGTGLVHNDKFSVARWNGIQWMPLGTIGTTVNSIWDLCIDSTRGKIYVVGSFTTIYGIPSGQVAQYDIESGTWSSIGNVTGGTVYTCDVDLDGNLYIGGSFKVIDDDENLKTLCKWTRATATWTLLGIFADTGTFDAPVDPRINAVKYDPVDHRLVVGGSFANVDDVANTAHIAQFDLGASQWSSLGTQVAGQNLVTDLVIDQRGGVYYTGNPHIAYVSRTGTLAQLTVNPYTFTPTITIDAQNYFKSIDIDTNGNLYGVNILGLIYILRSGSTTWTRIGSLTADVSIGNQVVLLAPPIDQGETPWMVVYLALKEIGAILYRLKHE